MLMMLASRLVTFAQSLGRRVLQTSGASGATGPEKYPADAHDARRPPRHICAITRSKGFANVGSLRGPLDQKSTQLMLMMLASRLVTSAQSLGRRVLQTSGAQGGTGPEKYPADAHDARLPPRHICAITLSKGFANVGSLRGPLDQKSTQLMLMMLASRLVTSAQSLGRRVLQTSGAWGATGPEKYPADAHDARLPLITSAQSLGRRVLQTSGAQGGTGPEKYPADAHDARLPPRHICAITRSKGFANVGSLGGHWTRTVTS